MKSRHVRIFLSTSQICTIYATLLAKATRQQGDAAILFIDGSKRKQGLIDLITKTSKIYPWTLLHDFQFPWVKTMIITQQLVKILPENLKIGLLSNQFMISCLKTHGSY